MSVLIPSRHSLMSVMHNLRVLTKQPLTISNLKRVSHVMNSYNGTDWYALYEKAYIDKWTNMLLAYELYMNSKTLLFSSSKNEKYKFNYNNLSFVERGKIQTELSQCHETLTMLLNNFTQVPKEHDYWTLSVDVNQFYKLKLIYLKEGEETPMHNHRGICVSTLLGNPDEPFGVVREIRWNGKNSYRNQIYSSDNQEKHHTIIYPTEFHQVKAHEGDVVMLNLYYHNIL